MIINFKDIQWHDLLTTDFWFDIDRSMLHLSDKLFLYGGGLLVILGIIALIVSRFLSNEFIKKVVKRVSKIFITIGLLEAIWFGLRMQYVQVLGFRFTALLIALAGLIWLYFPISYLITHYRTDMAIAARAASREKYLKMQ